MTTVKHRFVRIVQIAPSTALRGGGGLDDRRRAAVRAF